MTNYQLLQNKVNKLECLLESSKLLNSTLDIMDVLQALLSESIANIKDGDAGIIFLYNESLECLETKTSIGFNEEIEDLRLLPGESITGMTFTQKKTLDLQQLRRYRRNDKNHAAPIARNLALYLSRNLSPYPQHPELPVDLSRSLFWGHCHRWI